MFVISLSYKKDIIEIEKHIDAHIEYLKKYYQQEKFIASGRKEPRTGGIILVHNTSRNEIDEIIKEDPFYIADVAEYEIVEFFPTMVAKGLESIQEKI